MDLWPSGQLNTEKLNTKHSSVYSLSNVNRAAGIRSAASVSKGAGRLLSETMRGHQLQHQLQRALESCSRCLWHRSGEDPGAPSSSVFIRKSPSWGAANTVLADLGFILGSSCYGSSWIDCFTSLQLTSGSLYFPSRISGDAHFCNVHCLKVEDLAIITRVSATKDSITSSITHHHPTSYSYSHVFPT